MQHDPDNQAGPDHDPLCPNDPCTADDQASQQEPGLVGTTERVGGRRISTRHDPRDAGILSERDLDALLFVGLMRICAQYQLRARIFDGLSEVIVSRCVRRLLRRELIAVHRWNAVGINLLKLTKRGYDTLLERGLAKEKELYLPEKWTAPRDLAHTLWIVDVAVTFLMSSNKHVVLPCWALRRKFGSAGMVVPDILVAQVGPSGEWTRILAIEVDLGTERLGRIFLPKIDKLRTLTRSWAGEAAAAITILTRGQRRIEAIKARVTAHSVPVMIVELPRESGRAGLGALQELLQGKDNRSDRRLNAPAPTSGAFSET